MMIVVVLQNVNGKLLTLLPKKQSHFGLQLMELFLDLPPFLLSERGGFFYFLQR